MMILFLRDYFSISVFLQISIVLSLIIFVVSYLLASQVGGIEKVSPYECGFRPFEDARNTFDVAFYIIAILFILFDLEATFLFPWSVVLGNISFVGLFSMLEFLLELTFGYVISIKHGCFNDPNGLQK